MRGLVPARLPAALPLVAALLLLVPAVAQTAPGTRVEGSVVDVLGDPVPRAEVWVEGLKSACAASDGQGCFFLRGVPPGWWRVHASAPGRCPDWGWAKLDERTGEAFVHIRLLDAAPLTGRVLDADGKPAARALVLWTAPDKRLSGTLCHAWTDGQGRYRLPQTPVGPLQLTVVASGHDAAHSDLVIGGPTTSDIQLQRGPQSSYRITIKEATPAQWSELSVQLRLQDHSNDRAWDLGELWPHARDGDTLVYADLPANLGIAEVCVSVPHGDLDPRWLRVPVEAGQHAVASRVVPSSHEQRTPAIVRGTLRDRAGRPLAGRRVAQWRAYSPPDVTTTDQDGEFRLSTVVSDGGFFSLHLDEDAFVLHRDGAQEDYHYVIHAGSYYPGQSGSKPASHDLVADRAARVSGTVVDGAGTPVAGAEVRLLVNRYQGRNDVAGTVPDTKFAETQTARDGSFALPRLDGHLGMDLWLWIAAPRGVHAAPPFRLVPGQDLQLGKIALPAPAVVEGRILDQDDVPRPGIQVYLFRESTPDLPQMESLWTGHTDRVGRYRFSGLPAGDYGVKIDSPHSRHVEWPDYGAVRVKAGERKVVERGALR